MGRLIDEIDNRYGRLVVIKKAKIKPKSHARWICKCDCGTIKEVNGRYLREGKIKSCGCHKRDQTIKRNTKHGKSKSKLYNVWCTIKQRCNNPKSEFYHRYGGRGIKVCDEWNDYKPFYFWAIKNGYDESLTIDRIDNDGNYEPNNCRWATIKQQSNNRSNNNVLTINGEELNITQISKKYGISRQTIYRRYYKQNLRGKDLIKEGKINERRSQ